MTLPKETPMIERLARAFIAALPEDFYTQDGDNPRSCTIDGCGDITAAIGAVLNAIAEPTDRMLQAAYDAHPPQGTPVSDDSLNIARWKAMIAAISPEAGV